MYISPVISSFYPKPLPSQRVCMGAHSKETLEKYYSQCVEQKMPSSWLKGQRLRGKKILDIGTGRAEAVRILLESGADAYGIDDSEEQYIEKWSNEPRLKSRLVFAKAEALPFATNTFDMCYMMYSVLSMCSKFANENLKQKAWVEKQEALAEMSRVLKPGGVIRMGPVVLSELKELLILHPELKIRRSIPSRHSKKVTEKAPFYWVELQKD